jgi:hypothetical protein
MQRIFVVVRGGVAEVVESTVPAGVEVEIIDFDNFAEAPEETLAYLSHDARVWAVANA